MISVSCPGCGHEINCADFLAGLTVVCKNCGHRAPVPATRSSTPSPVTVEPATKPSPPPAPVKLPDLPPPVDNPDITPAQVARPPREPESELVPRVVGDELLESLKLESLEQAESKGRLILLVYLGSFAVMTAGVAVLDFLLDFSRLPPLLLRNVFAFALYYFLYQGSKVAKWITVSMNTLGTLVCMGIIFRNAHPLVIVIFGAAVAFFSSFTWFLLWSRRVKLFLETQNASWSQVGEMMTFALLAVVFVTTAALTRYLERDSSISWKYRSPAHNFALTLPSGDWREVKLKDTDVAFTNRNETALVGVHATPAQEGDYERMVGEIEAHFQRIKDELLTKPQFAEGETRSGHPYSYWTVTAKAPNGGEAFVARSLVWCKDKNLIVSVFFEGRLGVRSTMGKEVERVFHLNSAKKIFLSVE